MEPDVRMNPILLKPSSDVGSQVIVNGEVRGDMPAQEYFRHKKALIPDILAAYDSSGRGNTTSLSSRGPAARRRST